MASVDELRIQLGRLGAQMQAIPFAPPGSPEAQEGKVLRESLKAQMSAVQQEIDTIEKDSPTSSAGEVVSASNENNASASPSAIQTPASQVNPANVESGTNAPVRTLQQTQQVPQATIIDGRVTSASDPNAWNDGTGANTPPSPNAGQATIINGKVTSELDPNAWGSDDTVGVGSSSGNPSVIKVDNVLQAVETFSPRPNELDRYASYTYSASLYLMKPEALADMIKTGKKTIAGSQLLMQSAGAPVGGRNKYFTDDYYIDKIQLKSVLAGKGTNAAHNVNSVRMTIIEPNGLSLIQNLKAAVHDYLGTTGSPEKEKNFSAQLYLLVVRFYGYDENGNLINTTPSAGGTSSGSGPAFIEKYYPLAIQNIKFRISNKLVEYELEAVAPRYIVNVGTARGSIPFNIELSAMTVKEALMGKADYASQQSSTPPSAAGKPTGGQPTSQVDIRELDPNAAAPAAIRSKPTVVANNSANSANTTPNSPPTADAAPSAKTTVRKGIIEALNQWQQDLVKNKQGPTIPDVYSVEFVGTELEQAKITVPGGEKKSNAMSVPNSSSQQLNPQTQSNDTTTRVVSAVAGTQLIQFIDSILRNSSYIQDQMTAKTSEKDGKQVPNGNAKKSPVMWYKISLEATPINYDPGRNDYAYNVKYIIHPYSSTSLKSEYFPDNTSPVSVHKEFNYWFTGENTQVINYEQTYNAQYVITMSGAPTTPATTSNSDIKYTFQTRSNESSQGAAGRTNEGAANAYDYLYNVGDLAEANLSIVGDPAWLQQGEAFVAPTKANFTMKPFASDGTINFDTSEILFRMVINTPKDYNLSTGLMDVNSPAAANSSNSSGLGQSGSRAQRIIYKAVSVETNLAHGKFTQQLKGVLLNTPTKLEMNATGSSSNALTPVTSNSNSNSSSSDSDAGAPISTGVSGISASTRDSTMLSSAFDSAYARYKAGTPSGTVYTDPDGTVIQNNDDLPAPIQPQPAPPPAQPTSNGDITLSSSTSGPAVAATTYSSEIQDQLTEAQSYQAKADAATARGDVYAAATANRLAEQARENAAIEARQAAKYGIKPTPPQVMNREA